ncbi:MAG TPA: hypothetical protein DEV81_24060 [Cyanobacteria bacterium UBA11049]|nr:hypothetical protein [Cyanobacteria bacterium UBA11049]
MNKSTKALFLSLFFAAPVAICASAVQAKTVESHLQQVAPATTKKILTHKASKGDVYIAYGSRQTRGRETSRRGGR